MNKCYRLVWNSTLQAWTVACEFAKAKGKAGRGLALKALVSTGVLIGAMAGVEPANAWVAETGTSSPALDGGIASNTSINGGIAIATMNAIAMGPNATASGINAFAAGIGSLASGRSSYAMGEGAQSTNTDTIALGHNAVAKSANSAHSDMIAIGLSANASSDHAIAIGTSAIAKNSNSLAVGANATASGDASSAFGHNATASGSSSTALGLGATASKGSSVAIGYQSNSAADNSSAIGYQAVTSATSSIAFGTSAKAQAGATNAIAIGNAAVASTGAINAIAMGNGATSSATGAMAMGSLSQASAANALALGAGASATGLQSAAFGFQASATAQGAYAQGTTAKAQGMFSTALGTLASASENDSVAIGHEAKANFAGDVALGAGSVTDVAVGTTGVGFGGPYYGQYYGFAGSNPSSTVSVGSIGNERTITNVAAGRIAPDSTDAINGSELFATNSALNDLSYNVSNFAGDTSYSYTSSNGIGIRYARTNEAGLSQSDSSAQGMGSTAVGYEATSLGESSLALGRDARANNANDVALGADSVTDAAVGTSGVTIAGNSYNFAGTAPGSTVSVGSAGNERTITNVAAGRVSGSSTDAINGSQLFATNSAIDNLNVDVDNLDKGSVKYDVNGDGSINYNSVTLNPGGSSTTVTNVAAGELSATSTDAVNGSQLNDTNQNVTQLGDTITNIAGDTTTYNIDNHGTGIRYARTNEAGLVKSDASAEGQGSTAVGYNATSLGDSSLALGREASATHANDVALGAGSVTAAAVGTAGVTIRGDYYGFAGTAPVSTVSVGSVGHERTITNLAAGRIAASSTDAINGSQLFATNKAIDNLNLNVDVVDKSAVKYVTNTDGSINYNSVVMAGDTYNSVTKTGGTRINNVAYGIDPSDAVNVQQLNEATTNIYTNGVKYFHANSSKVDSIASGSDSIAVGPAAVASGTSAIAVGDGALAQGKGSTAVGQGAVASADGSVAIGKGANDNGRGAEQYTGKYSGAQNATAGTVSIGNAATGETRTLSNVADAKEATDGVNLRQLDGAVAQSNQYTDNSIGAVNNSIVNVDNKISNVDNRVTKVEGDVSNIQNGTDGMFQTNNTSNLPKPKPTGHDAVAGGAGAVASAANSVAIGTSAKATADNSVALGNNSVADRSNSVSVGSAGAERQITNVASGTADTDAVNVAQLNKSVGDITNVANDYADKRYNELKNDLDEQDDVLSAGIAGAMAMASLPQPYVPGASMASAGASTFRGQGAVAVGVSRISDNGKWVTKLQGSTTTQGDLGVAVGVGYQW